MAKKASKKTTKKASKKSTKAVLSPSRAAASYDLLGKRGDIDAAECMKHMQSVSARRKNKPIHFLTAAEVRNDTLPWRHFALQLVTRMHGMPMGRLVEIIAPDGVGKTTFIYWCLGGAMLANSPAFFLCADGKQLTTNHSLRCLHPSAKVAKEMMSKLSWANVDHLAGMELMINDWIGFYRGDTKRAARLAISIPLVIAIDPWSKLMSTDEAAGFVDWGNFMTPDVKEKFKETATGSNLGHARFAQDWSRRLKTTLKEKNVILIISHHQNTHLDMNGGFKPFRFSQLTQDLNNRNHRGGLGLNQIASLQLIMAKLGDAREGDVTVGHNVRGNIFKNSYGPSKQTFDFEMRTAHEGRDSGDHIDPAINFDKHLGRQLAAEGFRGMSLRDDLVSCADLGLDGASVADVGRLIDSNVELKQQLGKLYMIEGYYSLGEEGEDKSKTNEERVVESSDAATAE